ncbi:cytochrome c-type biogenesis protein CcmH [Idiomarina fontislapidosi]|uniref:Cytochrome c-type biogenesis protein n=1 Tax=Idiomarina fontislapidosi TaxID=263723 RepID=A0A432XYP1_9GAMM|nr:cytochrome c-type biogenesis protein [Idiomarina fontislapidosi]PYE32720.1 cytochrome c-type biogenesis protein CcmH [Idiomarina fontislapidosi]RUO53836.1 cystathionine gamma-synthase [Idiomarina fontislapidosi]|tara:strand:+ start:3068 stop:3544 length:477 start_codon:yes stop_codon:yes gene_type:complete
MRTLTSTLISTFAVLATLFSVYAVGQASIRQHEFETEAQRQLYQTLIQELRCPKCQNQNIADSNAPLSEDMRDRTYTMVMEGKSREEIIDYMVARYGNFVHYRPPFNWYTSILWWGPLLIIAIGVGVAWMMSRKRKQPLALSEEEQERLKQLRKPNHD